MANVLTFRRLSTPGQSWPLTFGSGYGLVGSATLAGTVQAGGLVAGQLHNVLTFRHPSGQPEPLTFRYTVYALNTSALDGTVMVGGLAAATLHPSALAGSVQLGGIAAQIVHASALTGWLGLGGLQASQIHLTALDGVLDAGGMEAQAAFASALDGSVQLGGLEAQWVDIHLSALDGVVMAGGLEAATLHPSALAGSVQLGGIQSGQLHDSELTAWMAIGGLNGRQADGTAPLDGCVKTSLDYAGYFDINVPSGPTGKLHAARADAVPMLARSSMDWHYPPPRSQSPVLPFSTGLAVASRLDATFRTLPPARSEAGLTAYTIAESGSETSLPYQTRMSRAACESGLALYGINPVASYTSLAFVHLPSMGNRRAFPWPAHAETGRWVAWPLRTGRILSKRIIIPLYRGVRLRPGRRIVIVIPPPPPRPPGFLTFVAGVWPVNWLVFNRSKPIRILPARRVYTVLNTFALYRLSDHTPLPAQSLTLADGQDAWAWTLNAGLAEMDAAELVAITEDGPVVVRAMVNGTEWDFIIEDPEGDETPEDNKSTLHGRSRTALLDAPYYPALAFGNDEDRLFTQAAGDLFYYNGVSLGVDVTATVDDWLIPAKQWSMLGTPVAALKRLAEAPGAALSSTKTGLGFALSPYYPVLPWDWADATPYAVIPRGYWESHRRRWETKPRYDSVIVAGDTANGLLVPIQREGSGGVWPAPQIIDRLMTSIIPARQRGGRILADTGRQALETISMPIGPEFGLIPKGALLELQDKVTWRGMVRSVSVSVALVGEGGMDVMQTLEVERHYG